MEAPHPRAQATQVWERGSTAIVLESVEAVGKNLLLRFEGGLVLRSHLRMSGRWRVEPRGAARAVGTPWLVLRTDEGLEGVLWNGPVLSLWTSGPGAATGPDVLADDFDVTAAVAPAPERRRGPPARRGAPEPAARGRDREHVDGGGTVGDPRLPVGAGA